MHCFDHQRLHKLDLRRRYISGPGLEGCFALLSSRWRLTPLLFVVVTSAESEDDSSSLLDSGSLRRIRKVWDTLRRAS